MDHFFLKKKKEAKSNPLIRIIIDDFKFIVVMIQKFMYQYISMLK